MKSQIQERLFYLTHRSYSLEKWFFWRMHSRGARRQKGAPILDFQMGKVGSSSVFASLKSLKLDRPLYHIHNLNRAELEQQEALAKKTYRTRSHNIIWQSQYLNQLIDQGQISPDNKWDVICLVRDPMARNLSWFFQWLEVNQNKDQFQIKSLADKWDFELNCTLDDSLSLAPHFYRHLPDNPFDFFTEELQDAFGTDLLQQGFDQQKGYQVYDDKLIRLLVIRLEDLNDCYPQAIKEFLGYDLQLINDNISSNKEYYELYKAFKKAFVPEQSYLDRMYEHPYVKLFYSEEEISRFKQKWSKSQTPA